MKSVVTQVCGLILVLALSGCAVSADEGAHGQWSRGGDGLLTDPGLQAVVDAQIRRDGAALVTYMGNEQAKVRARAAFAAGSVQDPRTRTALLTLLEDRDARVRADAAFAVGQLSDTTGTRVLVDRLREETDPAVRLQLIQATGRVGGQEAAVLLLRTTLEETELATLALALARIGNRGFNNAVAVERLVELTRHRDPGVRRNAAFFFGRSTSVSFWSPVIPRLRESLASYTRDDQAATWLLRGLAKATNAADTEVGVVWLAEGTDWRIRHAAAELLRRRGADGAVTLALMTALGDESPHVRESAAGGVAAPGRPLSESDQQFITTWIDEHPADTRTSAILQQARVASDPGAVTAWGERYPEDSAERAATIRALAVLPDASIVEREFALAEGEGAAARAALEVLGGRVTSSNAARLNRMFGTAQTALGSPDLAKVQLASELLIQPRIAPLGAVRVLGQALEGTGADVEIMRTLYRALAATEDATALPLLQAALESSDDQVRAIAAAGVESLTGEAPSYEPASREIPSVDWGRLAPYGHHPRITLTTEHGDVVVALDAEQAPLTTQTFLDIVEAGDLDGVPFHRVVPGFVLQGGDVTRGDGLGSAPKTIVSEFTRIQYGRGVVGMASSGKDTEGSQFFVTHLITPHLDGGYTSFGRVISGQEIADQVAANDLLMRAVVTP